MSGQNKREITRTRNGCWTCRRRRKRCDEARPLCKTCSDLGQMCEGYGVRLRWFTPRNHVRSSGQSAETKIAETKSNSIEISQSPCPNAATRAASLLIYLEPSVFLSLSDLEKEVLYDYAYWGAATLNSKSTIGLEHFAENLVGCSESTSMLFNCLTYQVTLDGKYSRYVDSYYDRSLKQFMSELSNPTSLNNIYTFHAGLMLCNISMNRGLPWTIHLNGIAAALQENGRFQAPDEEMRDLIALIGVLDLPTHVIGRRTSHLQIWKSFCCHQHGIEEGIGLPHSLVDLLAAIAEPDTEQRLLEWQYEAGDQTQQKIWQAARDAGILSLREFRVNNPSSWQPSAQQHIGPSTADIQRTLLLTLRGLWNEMNDQTFTGRQTLLFPLVMAGSQHSLLTVNDQSFIRDSMNALADNWLALDQYYGTVYQALQKFWAGNGQKSFDQTVRDIGLELGIF